jgi:hypothetical protein
MDKPMDLYEPLTLQLLICLFTADALGDFVLQTRRDADTKRQWTTLLRHAVVHSGLAYLLAGLWANWSLPLAVFVSHAAVDAVKARAKAPGARVFLVDQTAHLVATAAIAVWCARDRAGLYWVELAGEIYLKGLILFAGAVLTILAGGHLIALVVKPFLLELEAADQSGGSLGKSRGFLNGGHVIGCLERALILLFVLTGNPAGIGFLFAAKSILRFGEVKDSQHRMEAEYIIIGTLMSFGYGVLRGAQRSQAIRRHAQQCLSSSIRDGKSCEVLQFCPGVGVHRQAPCGFPRHTHGQGFVAVL